MALLLGSLIATLSGVAGNAAAEKTWDVSGSASSVTVCEPKWTSLRPSHLAVHGRTVLVQRDRPRHRRFLLSLALWDHKEGEDNQQLVLSRVRFPALVFPVRSGRGWARQVPARWGVEWRGKPGRGQTDNGESREAGLGQVAHGKA